MEEKIAELEKKIAELKAQLKEKKNKGKWMPEENEKYFSIDEYGAVQNHTNFSKETLKLNMIYSRIFKTKEKAEQYRDYLKARHEYSYEFTREEWENPFIKKNFIFYDEDLKKLSVDYHYTIREMNKAFFKTKEKALEFINKYEKEILEFEFGVEE